MKLFCKFCHRMVEPLDGYYYKKCPICYHALPKDPNRWLIYISVIFGIITILCMALSSAYSATANVSTTSTIGTIRGDFYGVNTHGKYFANNTWLANSTGGLYTVSNFTWHRDTFLATQMKVIRIDSNLRAVTPASMVFTTTVPSTTANINTKTETIKWAYENNISVILILQSMPWWLANTTIAEAKCSNNNDTCPPTNYTKWGEVVVAYINNVTSNGTYASAVQIEVWNEPDLDDFWLAGIGEDATNASIRSKYYNLLYSATYTAVKAAYPTMKVGGPAFTADDFRGTTMMQGFLSNFTNQFDFISVHRYLESGESSFSSILQTKLNNLIKNCTAYGAACDNIYLDEYNVKNSTIQNTSTYSGQFGSLDADALSALLNTYPSRVSASLYHWSEYTNYSNTAYYPGYPYRWSMVSEPQMDNVIYSTYNITKLFATNHKAGNTVLNSSSNDTQLKVVASKDSAGKYYITLTNTNSTKVNVTLSFSNTIAAPSGYYTYLRNVENNEYYNLTDNRVTIHDISGYGVMTLRGDYAILTTTQLCLDTLSGFEEFGSWIVILIIVSVAGFLIFMLMGEDVNMDIGNLNGIVVAIIIAAICFGIGSVIIAQLNPGC